uniref:Coiled-coil domain-containing protein 172 n=1 Tax=Amazona collaria TaxID=241587 RepID=A0A8B9IVF9_9PSIT
SPVLQYPKYSQSEACKEIINALNIIEKLFNFHLNIPFFSLFFFFFQTDAKRKMTEEEDNFTREVTEFNNEYGLTSNRDLMIKKKVKTEINDLENEAALLKNEMESMEHKNVQLNALQLQKNELKQDVLNLQNELKGVHDNLSVRPKSTDFLKHKL